MSALYLLVEGLDMSSSGWKYKGTKQFVRQGDIVRMSKRYAKEFAEIGTVVSLNGFITVQFANGDKVDFDARSVSFVRQSESTVS